MTFRELTLDEAELAAADELLMLAYESPSRRTMLQLYRETEPGGWLVAEADGRLVAIGGALSYGSFGWIGLVATHPASRGQGLARAISQHLALRLEAGGAATAALDASDAGRPVYERLGFEAVGWTRELELRERVRGKAASTVTPATPSDVAELTAEDARCFGGDRSALLTRFFALPGTAVSVARDERGALRGYLATHGAVIGPGVALDADAAAALLMSVLSGMPIGSRLLVPSESSYAALCAELGLVERRRLAHMRRGDPALPGARTLLLAQLSFAAG